jgi:hypothetical protein
VLDVLYVLDKREGETWAQWSIRAPGAAGPLVQLRTRPSARYQ